MGQDQIVSLVFPAKILSTQVCVAIVELRSHLIPAIVSLSVVGRLLTRTGIAGAILSDAGVIFHYHKSDCLLKIPIKYNI